MGDAYDRMRDLAHEAQRERSGFQIKDSGARQEFEGGMMRDTAEGKIDFTSILFGPMLKRWAEHMTKGRAKYPDPELGVPNWTRAQGQKEYERAKQSLMRHVFQYLEGDQDEDHASAIYFNINLMEYVKDRAGRVGDWKLVGDQREHPSGRERCPQQCLRFNRSTGGGSYVGCILDKGHDGDHEA